MDRLTAAHRQQLLGLRAATLRELRLLWPSFDPDDRTTWDRFARPATLLLQRQHAVAVALGKRYYEAMRLQATGVLTPNEVTLPPMNLDAERVAASMAATGLAGTYIARGAGKSTAAALDNGFVRVGMAASRLVLAGARDAVTTAGRGDAANRGWIRRADGEPCKWCADRDGVFMTDAEVFPAHDGCSCVAEPAWA